MRLEKRRYTTENNSVVHIFQSEGSPTLISIDGSNVTDVAVVDTVEDGEMIVKHERIATGGNTRFDFFEFAVPGSVGWHYMTMNYPYNINIHSGGCFDSTTRHVVGDKASMSVKAGTIGVVTADVTTSTTVIDVNQTVVDNMEVGYFVKITDGVNADDLGRCLLVDMENNQITVENAPSNAYLASTPSYIQMDVDMVVDLPLGVLDTHHKLEGGFDSAYLSANTDIEIAYFNSDGGSNKILYFVFEIFY